jgi:hypothetical protein
MPLPIRSVEEREEQIIADLQSESGQVVPAIEESWDRFWARVQAGMAKIVDLAVNRAAKNILPSKTQSEPVLEEFAGWAESPRGEEVQTILNVLGTGITGEIIGGGISGVQYVYQDGQKFYFEDDFTIPSDSFETQVTAFRAGAAGNLRRGELLITGQNANISSVLTIKEADPIAREGRDEQLFESWRVDVNRGLQQPVLPDNYSFFYKTTKGTPGGEFSAGYAYTGRPGQLKLYGRTKEGNGVPDAPQLQALEDWYDGTTDNVVRIPPHYADFLPDDPTVKRFLVLACSNTGFRVRVTGMSPNNPETQALVGQDIVDWFADREPYVKGQSVTNKGTLTSKALESIVQDRVESGDIQKFTAAEFSKDGATFIPIAEYPLGEGELSSTDTSKIEWPS